MLLWIRDLIRKNPDVPWPSVMDGLRPFTEKIWLKWTIDEKKYFLRRIRPYWEIARHRIPANRQRCWMKWWMQPAGLKKGYIVEAIAVDSGIEIVYRSEGNDIRQVFHKVINCTGPESNYRRFVSPSSVIWSERKSKNRWAWTGH